MGKHEDLKGEEDLACGKKITSHIQQKSHETAFFVLSILTKNIAIFKNYQNEEKKNMNKTSENNHQQQIMNYHLQKQVNDDKTN